MFFFGHFFFRFSKFRHNFCVAFLVSKSFIMSLAFDEYGRPFLIVKVPTPLASRRLPLLQPPSSSSSPLSFSRRLLFFSTPKRFKSRLSFDRKTKAHTLDVSFTSLSLSLYTLGTKLQAETSRHRGAKGKHHRREERGENAEK